MKKFLIIQTAFLGDAILATALVEQLHAHRPQDEISILVRKGNESLFKGHPFLKEVLVWDKKNGKTSNLFRLLSEIRSRNYDEVINLQRFFSTGLLTAFSGAKITAGFDKNPLSFLFKRKIRHIIGDGRHEVSRNLELTGLTADNLPDRPVLYPGTEDNNKVAGYKSQPYVCLAPASVWFTKQLPEEKWAELLSGFSDNIKPYLIGGPDDASLCEKIIHHSGNRIAVNLAGKTNLLATASLMRDALMNYVNDSGPLHIASAVNAPVTAFFCSTLPSFGFGPLSDNQIILETPEKLKCRPCGLHGKKACPEGHFKCGTTIMLPQPLP